MARLDRLPSARQVAQIGAVIGREFSYEMLAAVAERSEVELRSALERLEAAELIHRCGGPPDNKYSFKHALVRDAAYGSILKSRRRALHGRIAALSSAFADSGARPAGAAPRWRRHGGRRGAHVRQSGTSQHRKGRRE